VTIETAAGTRGHALALLPAIVVAIGALLSGAAVAYAPAAKGEMAVLFAPWVSEADALRTIVAAGGEYVGPTRFGNLLIAFAPDDHFAERVRQAGALMLLAATGVCGELDTPSPATGSS
jgi:hypothetical protein